ncbi:DsbA family protein [Duganella radicis]|uniref:DsbA family protein n=1 Tax=Duganella radicis TaxID=551988 RepID=A0A6L6PDT9_9BURK|nr:DsbA family protein [Duganella radicis]MTV36505.1 DsbA family protein [Duganella radicis]
MTTLHYIFDPLCGWCYAAAPLISAARSFPGMRIEFHGGGMMTGPNARTITPDWREYVMPHDLRIRQLTGQPFGAAYFDGLLRDTTAVMDSAPPTTAILAAQELAGQGLDMLHRLQHAHYAEGRRIADLQALVELALEMGLDETAFAAAFARLSGPATDRHFAESRKWLARCGGQGFPTVALQRDDGVLERIDLGRWLGRVDEWRAYLDSQAPSASQPSAVNPGCDTGGCAI